jgi:hypothetical protein
VPFSEKNSSAFGAAGILDVAQLALAVIDLIAGAPHIGTTDATRRP